MKKRINSAVQVAIYFTGVAAMVYGVWLIYRPLGFLVGGIFCVLLALMLDKQSDSQR